DPYLAASDPDRGRTTGRVRHRVKLRRLARHLTHPEAVRQCRSGCDSDRQAARLLPYVAESDRGDGQGRPLRAGGLAGRDRAGRRELAARARLIEHHFLTCGSLADTFEVKTGHLAVASLRSSKGSTGSRATERDHRDVARLVEPEEVTVEAGV